MKKVLIYSPNPLDGVSYYRQWGPMSALHSEVQCVQFPMKYEEYSHWTWYLNYDVCLFSRPHRPNDVVFAEQCKKYGLPLWVDYDDALLHITDDNPVYTTFCSTESRRCISEILKLANVVSVCSKLQKTWLEEKMGLRNVVHIPNALDDRFLRHAKPFKMSKKIAWRGSDSHVNDLLFFKDEIKAVMEKTPRHQWLYFGVNPYFLKPETKNWAWAKPMNLTDFVIEFCKFNPSFVFVPLIDNFFNRVKSHLAWFDATLAGAVCMGPAFEEWVDIRIWDYQADDFQNSF